MKTVLVVDDKEMLRDSVGSTLQRAGFAVLTAPDGPGALRMAAERRPDVLVTDLKMPGMTGLELLEAVRGVDADVPVVLMTAFATVETAVQAMKLGAFDYVTKPFRGDELVIAVKRACQHAVLVRENAVLRAGDGPAVAGPAGVLRGVERLIGSSAAMRRVREQVAAVAESQGTVMVVGESGSGKEVVARAVHESSPRASEPYLAVNCAALSESLLESELFGHEKGSFTGADRLRKGRFELADRGTLLLDEVSEIAPSLQAKLLRVLQERSFERVGSSLSIGVDVRVVATSNRDLPRSVSRGEFRQDLFFRLNVLPIHLPPLRERLEDVAELAAHFAGQICAREGLDPVQFEPGALSLLSGYGWPGNVRELQNICERAVVLSRAGRRRTIPASVVEPWLSGEPAFAAGPGLTPGSAAGMGHGVGVVSVESQTASAFVEHAGVHRHEASGGMPVALNGSVTLEEIERQAIVTTLTRYNGHRQKTAKSLGIGVRTLGLKLKKWKAERLVPESL